jgi:hypothetical protein
VIIRNMSRALMITLVPWPIFKHKLYYFSEMLKKIQKLFLPNQKNNIVKDNSSEYFRNISFVEMKISKLISYSTDMCFTISHYYYILKQL